MVESMLQELLRAIVKHYGIKRVELALRKVQHSDDERTHQTEFGQSVGNGKQLLPLRPSKRSKVTAALYIAKLDIPPEKRQPLTQLANKFEDKKFLPTLGEIRNFCIVRGVGVSSVSSRVAAIPHVFRFLSTLSADDIQAISQSDLFSGPSQLASVADAFRRKTKDRMEADRTASRTTTPQLEDPTNSPPSPKKPSVPKRF